VLPWGGGVDSRMRERIKCRPSWSRVPNLRRKGSTTAMLCQWRLRVVWACCIATAVLVESARETDQSTLLPPWELPRTTTEDGAESTVTKLVETMRVKYNSPVPFIQAAKRGNLNDMQAMVVDAKERWKDLLEETEGTQQMSAYLWAAREGHSTVVEYLLKKGVQVDASDRDGTSAMFYAASGNHLATVTLMSQYGGKLTLHIAAMVGLAEQVERIILDAGSEAGTVVNADYYGWTPLHLASNKGRPAAVLVLLKYGADVNRKDSSGYSAMHKAAYDNYADVVKMLHLQGNADLNTQSHGGETALLVAVARNSVETVQYLLQHGANATIKDKYGTEALTLALQHNFTECIELLRQHVTKGTYSAESRFSSVVEKYGNSKEALHHAIAAGQEDDVVVLITGGIDVNGREAKFRYTPLDRAAMHGHADIITRLIAAGATPTSKSLGGYTPLHYAAERNYPNAIKALHAFGKIELDVKSYDGYTAVAVAAENGCLESLELLLSLGASPNIRDAVGNTPYALAARSRHENAMSVLKRFHGQTFLELGDPKGDTDTTRAVIAEEK
jgi:uncharacterized protein